MKGFKYYITLLVHFFQRFLLKTDVVFVRIIDIFAGNFNTEYGLTDTIYISIVCFSGVLCKEVRQIQARRTEQKACPAAWRRPGQ